MMQPLYIDGCFGWIHQNEIQGSDLGKDLGVVLCNPLGNEAICSHREWMELANMLAAQGLTTLRFDYLSSGDSAEGVSSVAIWLDSICTMVRAFKARIGVGRIALCGLRLGSALAALAATRLADEGVVALVMLAPVVSGRQLVREWRVAAGAAHLAAFDPPPSDPNDALNATGFLWPANLLQDIETIDLTKAEMVFPPHVLLMRPIATRFTKQLVVHITGQGRAVSEEAFPGYDALMNEPLAQATPHLAFTQLAGWLAALAESRQGAVLSLPAPQPMQGDGWVETPLRFGRDDALFGVMCEPAGRRRDLAVMMLHTGTSHHIGNGRILVDCARALAQAGIASLRMDVAGIGDSPNWPEDPANPLYGPHNLSDVRNGLDALGARGWNRAMTVGICAGAYLALQAALDDPRVVALMAVNLQSFRWVQGSSLEVAIRRNKRSLRSYLQSTRNPNAWKRVLRGEGDLPGIAAVMVQRGMAKIWRNLRDMRPPPPGSRIHDVRQEIQSLKTRAVHGWFVWSDDDPGLESLHEYFGARGKHLRHTGMHALILPNTDHNMNDRRARQIFLRLLMEYADKAAS